MVLAASPMVVLYGRSECSPRKKAFINSTYRIESREVTHVYLYSYTYVKLLRRFKRIIGESQADLARFLFLPLSLPIAATLKKVAFSK